MPRWMPIVLALAACGREPEPTAPEPAPEWLSPSEHLVRASIAVRGVRPSEAELDAVAADPQAFDTLLDEWLAGPEFGATIRDLHAEALRFRVDTNLQFPAKGPLEGVPLSQINGSMTEAPLRMVEDIVLSDQPYTEILTADWILADATLATIYGLQRDPDGPEWQRTWWTDGRPPAGLLSSSELYRRYSSNGSNFHRGRANVIAATFLCDDIGQRPIEVDDPPVATRVDEVAAALANDPSCAGCHQALEPIASFLWGFKAVLPPKSMSQFQQTDCESTPFDELDLLPPGAGFAEDICYPVRLYHPAEEQLWAELGLPAPALYGRPGERIDDLGRMITEDPRFATCTARRFQGWLMQVDPEAVPDAAADALASVLVDSGWSARALVRHIVTSDSFRTRRGTGDPDAGLLTIRPEQYARLVTDITGFRWLGDHSEDCAPQCWGTVDLATSDLFGFRTLSGGIDGIQRTAPTHTATPTKVLAMTRFAAEAADDAVDRGALVDVGVTDEAGVRDQLAALHQRVLGRSVAVDGPEVDATWALFDDALARRGPAGAYKLVLTALLTDPEVLNY